LGWSYKNRNANNEENEGAIYWYTKAALAGHPYAQYNLGLCYKNGTGVIRDFVEAVRWIRKAAEQNDPDAQHSLGLRYKSGEGVHQDNTEALRWFTKAAAQGYGYSQYNLGGMYKKGRGTAVDYYKSFLYYEQAANQGDDDAKKKLKKFNQDPLLSEVMSTQWPTTHHKLHINCQSAIMEIFYFNRHRPTDPIPIELIRIISRFIIKYWPTDKEPHQPYYQDNIFVALR